MMNYLRVYFHEKRKRKKERKKKKRKEKKNLDYPIDMCRNVLALERDDELPARVFPGGMQKQSIDGSFSSLYPRSAKIAGIPPPLPYKIKQNKNKQNKKKEKKKKKNKTFMFTSPFSSIIFIYCDPFFQRTILNGTRTLPPSSAEMAAITKRKTLITKVCPYCPFFPFFPFFLFFFFFFCSFFYYCYYLYSHRVNNNLIVT
jgi:hypothetical protein